MCSRPGDDLDVDRLRKMRCLFCVALDDVHIDSLFTQAIGNVGADLPGAANDPASWTGAFYNARSGTIYAGTSQVQRNIIGEMVLGLPKEPKPQPAKA